MRAAAAERAAAGDDRNAAVRAAKKLRRALREQAVESHMLLCAGVQHAHGLDPVQLAPLLSLVRRPQ